MTPNLTPIMTPNSTPKLTPNSTPKLNPNSTPKKDSRLHSMFYNMRVSKYLYLVHNIYK
jgi:hypothetical protein